MGDSDSTVTTYGRKNQHHVMQKDEIFLIHVLVSLTAHQEESFWVLLSSWVS